MIMIMITILQDHHLHPAYLQPHVHHQAVLWGADTVRPGEEQMVFINKTKCFMGSVCLMKYMNSDQSRL